MRLVSGEDIRPQSSKPNRRKVSNLMLYSPAGDPTLWEKLAKEEEKIVRLREGDFRHCFELNTRS